MHSPWAQGIRNKGGLWGWNPPLQNNGGVLKSKTPLQFR